jgi:hypothetical protein
MVSKALIGYTGFVGGNLDHQQSYDDRFNSRNIENIDGRHFDLLVCAGVPAEKWLANKDPQRDREILGRLRKHLGATTADKVVLISTIDVYPNPISVDENSYIDIDSCQPYGKHRLELERYLADHFDTLIIRLPGLFGRGLKKNIIYDFLHDNETYKINPRGLFQFYYLDHLTQDIEVAMRHNLKVLNIATEPVGTAEVALICLGHEFENEIATPAPNYDFRSLYAGLFGGSNGYLYNRQQVIDDLAAYVTKARDGAT